MKTVVENEVGEEAGIGSRKAWWQQSGIWIFVQGG